MVSSGRQAIARILLIFCIAVYSQAQTNPPKEPTASISGKVTIKGKGAPGITVIASDPNYYNPWGRQRYRATTDPSGNYTISNLAAGKYRVEPRALAFAVENEQGASILSIADGETIEDVNFVLMRGGVITGKITDSDGQPVVEVPVTLAVLTIKVKSSELAIASACSQAMIGVSIVCLVYDLGNIKSMSMITRLALPPELHFHLEPFILRQLMRRKRQ